jgi:hypothetical protein
VGPSDGLVDDADGSRLDEAKLVVDDAEGGLRMVREALMGLCRNCVGANEGVAFFSLTP